MNLNAMRVRAIEIPLLWYFSSEIATIPAQSTCNPTCLFALLLKMMTDVIKLIKISFFFYFQVSFGGLAGLFLGISLLSVAEICFHILSIFFSVCFRK